MIDLLGVRVGIILYCSLVTLGHSLFTFGVSINSFPIALLGRGIFGCGAESLVVAQSTVISKWYTNKDLSMALSMNISFSSAAGILNFIIEPYFLSLSGNITIGLWFGLLVCLVSFLCGTGIVVLDRKRERILRIKTKRKIWMIGKLIVQI